MMLTWDEIGERLYETGVKKGVIYPQVGSAYPKGYAWNGLTGFEEAPDGGEANDYFADDIQYISIRAREKFKATIKAYTYPDAFAACDGSAAVASAPGVYVGQQPRKPFGFSCVSTIGNDTEFEDYGYKIHLVWGATVSPSSKEYQPINDSPEPMEMSWDMDTLPVKITGFKPTAHMEIDSTKANPTKLKRLEDILYGTATTEARLPLPDEVIEIMTAA